MIELREGSAADRDAILGLRTRCFPDDDPEKQDPRFWEWEFARGRYFVADDGGRAVAHIGFVPQLGMLAVDAMTDPDYRRQGLFTRVVAFARDAIRNDAPYSGAFQIRDAVLPAMTRNGWKVILRAPVLVRPLTMRAFLRSAGGSPAVPRAASPRRPAAGDTAGEPPAVHRTEDFFRWRFYENPLWHYDITQTPDAYLVTRRTTLRELDTLAIVDLACRPGHERELRLLLRQAVARGREEGADVAAVLITLSHPALPMLVRGGFLPSPHRFRFLVNVFDESVRAKIARRRWALTWADTDHL